MDNMNIEPLKNYITSRGIKQKWLCEQIGVDASVFSGVLRGKSMFKTDTIAKIACLFRIPVSQVVEFTGIEYKSDRAVKLDSYDKTPPEYPVGLPSYQPLRDFVEDFYKDKANKETLDDVLDHIERDQKYVNSKSDENVKKMLEARGVDTDNLKHDVKLRPGMNYANRNKIKHDLPVTMSVIYNICKLLKCNVDFVFTWR